MKHKKTITSVAFLLLGLGNLQAQQTVTSTGGEATGTGGTTNYTIGQVVYTTNTGANGSVAQGVQQPYEISVVTGISEAKDISLTVVAYPNPTTDYLTLKVENYETANLQYKIFDINGKLLQSKKAEENETKIEMNNFATANYFVKVLDNKREIKTFKIIKK